jgi:hypothetical protein
MRECNTVRALRRGGRDIAPYLVPIATQNAFQRRTRIAFALHCCHGATAAVASACYQGHLTHGDEQPSEDHMFAYMTERRLLGFDTGDWALLFGGFALVGLMTLLTT